MKVICRAEIKCNNKVNLTVGMSSFNEKLGLKTDTGTSSPRRGNRGRAASNSR